MERIEDINKAQAMAEGEKLLRDKTRFESSVPWTEQERLVMDKMTERCGTEAGEDYERDKGRVERGQQQKKEQEKSKTSPETLSKVVEGLIESSNRLARVLEVRESQGLSQFIDPAEIPRLRAALMEVQNFHNTKDTETLLQNLNTIASVVDKFGRAPSTRIMKESNESFDQTILALKTVEASFRDATLLVSERDPQIRSILQKIANLAQQRWLLVAKKRDILRSYLR